MFRTLIRGLMAASVVALAACGGGSSTTCQDGAGGTACGGGGGGGGGGAVTASDLVLVLSANSVPNTGTTTVQATVTALDGNRNALAEAPVTISADNGGVVTVAGNATETSEAGILSASVSIGSDTSLRTITVTAVSGDVTTTATLQVVAGTDAVTPATVELVASSTSVGTGGTPITITAFVKDANNNAMADQAVTFTTDTGTLSNVATRTNASGAATASFSAGSDRSNRTATINVNAGAIRNQLAVPIAGTKLTVSGPTSLTLNSSATYAVTAVDSNGNALSDIAITATSRLANALAPSSATTDANGQVQVTLTASNAGDDTVTFRGAGTAAQSLLAISGDDFAFTSPAENTNVNIGTSRSVTVRYRIGGVAQQGKAIDFSATGGTLSAASATTNASGQASVSISSTSAGPVIVQATVRDADVSTTLPLSFVATDPHELVLQVAQSALPPNPAGTSSNSTQVVAKVTDPNGNPVANKVVNFRRVTDPSGGSLQRASATTDSSGQAAVSYISGPESTATNGVVLEASVAEEPAVAGTATLTVNQSALFITLGTGNVIDNIDPQTYRKDWVVYVTDANGIAVSGVSLTFRVVPLSYARGGLTFIDPSWVYDADALYPLEVCPNEDLDNDGILDAGEDSNGDGVLWPGNVVAVTPGSAPTGTDGRATVSLVYAENYAPWVRVQLIATARVSGTESSRTAVFTLPGAAEDFSDPDVPPAGVESPFGNNRGLVTTPGCSAATGY